MKTQIVTILFVISQFMYSQHPILGVVEYKVESVTPIDSIKLSVQKDDKIVESDKKKFIELISEPAFFVLEFNSFESSYRNNQKMMQSDEDKKFKVSFLQIFGGGENCNYYTNVQDKITLGNINAFGETFIISYNFPEWEITSETKKIGNYTCYKAIQKKKDGTLHKNEEVWYTPEIPNQFGPNNHVGLPGMILEIIAGKVRIIATKISLNNEEEKVNIEVPTKGVRLTEEEFNKKVIEFGKQSGF